MTIIPKAFVGAVAAGAMAIVPAAASAQSRYDYRDNNRGISAGEIIAGAVILGGIAAVAGSIGGRGSDYRSDNRYYRNGNYGYYNGNPRAAVQQCVGAASNDARRRGYNSAQVTQIRDVDDTRNGWRVKGNLVVESGRGYYNQGSYGRGYDRNYNNGYYNNSRYDDDRRGYARDGGSFTCWIDRGRVSRIDYSGIRGL